MPPRMKSPGPDHPMSVERTTCRVIVRAGGQVIADSVNALTLREADYAAVHYVPRSDVKMTLLRRSAHKSYCPYKGEASYLDILHRDFRSIRAAWSYELPYEAATAITGYVAFDPERVASLDLWELMSTEERWIA